MSGKKEKELYLPKEKPELVRVPKQKFFMIKGKGNPNHREFAEKIAVLYALSYAVKMMPKKGFTPDGYYDYTVYPLEGVWDLTEKGRKSETLDKNELLYTIMIRQPDFVSDEIAEMAFEAAGKKKARGSLQDAYFKSEEEELSVQMLHVGPYDDEYRTFDKMNEFLFEKNLKRMSMVHREIYLSDFRKTAPEKLKTVLRYGVKE